MQKVAPPRCLAFVLAALCLLVAAGPALAGGEPISGTEIAELQAKLIEAGQSASAARQKLAVRRAIRQGEALIKSHPDAANRFAVLGVLFKAQQTLIELEDSQENRAAFIETCRNLAAAPDEYAAVRLDADLLLSQIETARRGEDINERAKAMLPLIDRYQGTAVEARVIKIAMVTAIELGDAALIQELREIIAERCPSDLELIGFMRDQLAGQVFGAPFVGRFESSDGKAYWFPMDALGKTTALYFWTREGDGIEQLKEMAKGWEAVVADPERNPEVRYQFVSFNLDGLPDAGASILREAGLDWPAMHLPGGVDHPVYKTYVRNTPKLLTMTPTGYTAMVMSGSTRVKPGGWERAFGSGLSRSWSREDYNVQTQAILTGEFTIVDPIGEFDPTAPPEWKAVYGGSNEPAKRLKRTAASVPEDRLRAIQGCFVKPPMRYELSYEQLLANFSKADELCRRAIAAHPDADDLWIVRNRRIVALMGLWKVEGNREHFDAAVQEAELAIDKGYPAGTDVIARFCLARQAMRAESVDRRAVIERFVQAHGDEPEAVTTPALASLLALDIADRPLHEKYRRASLDQFANHPAVYTATAFHLDRYHRYWLYHPPFTAGWTYGRRMDYFFSIGDHEDANRTVKAEFETLDGKPFRIPEDLGGKFTMIEFLPSGASSRWLQRAAGFVGERPFDDINIIYAILDEDADAARQAIESYNQEQIKRRRQPDNSPNLIVPGGYDHPIVLQLGLIGMDDGNRRPVNVAFLHPNGGVAAFMSGMTGSKGNMAQSVVEWNDERAVDQALAKGDLEEAKRLAFALAPVEQIKPEDAPRHWKPRKLTVPHLRARAKVFMAMKDWQAAYDDIEEVFLAEHRQAGYLSMRTDDLIEAERLRAIIQAKLEPDATDE